MNHLISETFLKLCYKMGIIKINRELWFQIRHLKIWGLTHKDYINVN